MEEEDIPSGIHSGACLVVDQVAMDSMASEEPWVHALDSSFDHKSPVPEGQYLGYFRVAVDSVLTELYPMLPIIPLEQPWSSDGRI